MCVTSGVRQGCPLSPVLFLLATAPIINALEAVVGPEDLLAMFADDLAIVPRPPLVAHPPRSAVFARIRRHTVLGLQSGNAQFFRYAVVASSVVPSPLAGGGAGMGELRGQRHVQVPRHSPWPGQRLLHVGGGRDEVRGSASVDQSPGSGDGPRCVGTSGSRSLGAGVRHAGAPAPGLDDDLARDCEGA